MPLSPDAHPAGGRRRRTGRLWLALALLGILTTLALTVPRCLDTTNYRLIQLAAATPAGAPAAALSVLVALVATWRASTSRRRWAAVASTAVAAGLLGLHLAWLAPLYTGTVPSAQPGPPLVVFAQNFEYGTVEDLAAAAAAAKADVIVLSDMGSETARSLTNSSLVRDYPATVGLVGEARGGVVVLSKEPILDSTTLDGNTSARVVRLATSQLGTIDVLALHPPPGYRGGEWRSMLSRATTYLHQRPTGGDRIPIVVAGDLNATAGNRPFRQLTSGGLADAVEQANDGLQPTWPAPGAKRIGQVDVPPMAAIDHVLLGDGAVALDTRAVALPGADHLGLVVGVGIAVLTKSGSR